MRVALQLVIIIVSAFLMGMGMGHFADTRGAVLRAPKPMSPEVAAQFLGLAGWSNIALHADQGTNCLWLGMSNLSMLPVRFFTNGTEGANGTNAGAGGKQPKLTGKANDEI